MLIFARSHRSLARFARGSALLSALALVPACGEEEEEDAAADPLADAPAVIERYADGVLAGYEASHAAALELRSAVALLVSEPSEEALADAREAWLTARVPYGQTEVFRFYGGPIDDDDGPEGQLNAWPMDEAYVDVVVGSADGGIIQRAEDYPELTAEVLAGLNEAGGETNISTGYHAIEFLLWGQDLNDPETAAGQRPASDFDPEQDEDAERRGAYLLAVADLLVADLESLVAEWEPDADNYRAEFLGLPPADAVERILKGMGSLSGAELAGERLTVAYDTQEQEDEHSCFSDNTTEDVRLNALGIENVYLGRVDGEAGVGIRDLVAAADPELAEALAAQLARSVELADAIPAPFDRAIQGADDAPGRVAVRATIDSLQDQTDLLSQAAAALGVSLNLEE